MYTDDWGYFNPYSMDSTFTRAMTANPDGGLLFTQYKGIMGITQSGSRYNYTKLYQGITSRLPCELSELTIEDPYAIHANYVRVLTFDRFRAQLISINKSGRCERFAGIGVGQPRDGPRLLCCLEDIRSIIQDAKGTYYMTETRTRQIRALSASGYVTTIATLPFSGLPDCICIRPSTSDILVASLKSDSLLVVNSQTRKTSTLKFSHPDFQGPPAGLCALANGSVLITEKSHSPRVWSLAPTEIEPVPLSGDPFPETSGATLCTTTEGRVYFARPATRELFYVDDWARNSAPCFGPSKDMLSDDEVSSGVGDFTPLRVDAILDLLDSSSKIEVENRFSRFRFTLVISFLELVYGSSFVSDFKKWIEETKTSNIIIDAVISIIYGAASLDVILPFDHAKQRCTDEEMVTIAQVYSALSGLGFDSKLISDRIRFVLAHVPKTEFEAFVEPFLDPEVSAQPAAKFMIDIMSASQVDANETKEVQSYLLTRMTEISLKLQYDEFDAEDCNFKISISDTHEIYHVHDWVLVCRWAYLLRVLKAGMMEAQTRHLELPSEVPTCFVKPLLVYLYCGKIDPAFSMSPCAPFILSDGDLLGFFDFEGYPKPVFSELVAHCQQMIQSPMTPTNALIILEHRLKQGVEEEVRDATEFCSRNLLSIADFETQIQALERLPGDTIADIFFGTLSRLPERPFETA